MRSVRDIIKYLNDHLVKVLPGGRFFGIATPLTRGQDVLPAEGETYIGIDDINTSQVYHKITGVTVARQAQGFGDRVDQMYTYACSMIVFLNNVCFAPEDILPILQSSLPQQFKTDYTKRVSINFLSAVLNDQQIHREEYANAPFRLSTSQRLFRVNYNLEVLYKPGCFDICPEEINCKN